MKTPRILLTVGDVNGIGPEVMLKSLVLLDGELDYRPTIVGAPSALAETIDLLYPGEMKVIDRTLHFGSSTIPITSPGAPPTLNLGTISASAGKHAGLAISIATRSLLAGEADGMVTMPISKEALHLGGYRYPGHTEMIAEITDSSTGLMVLFCEKLRVAMLTGHLPLCEVAGAISQKKILETVLTFDRSLRIDFGIASPQLCLLGLNPHAGDGGAIGTEEGSMYQEALKELQLSGVHCDGPFAADAFFGRSTHERYDGVIASYHDQGLIPMKMLADGDGVNFTAGLPIVRTSPDHGTAFDIAGKGIASAESSAKAIRSAVEIVLRREQV